MAVDAKSGVVDDERRGVQPSRVLRRRRLGDARSRWSEPGAHDRRVRRPDVRAHPRPGPVPVNVGAVEVITLRAPEDEAESEAESSEPVTTLEFTEEMKGFVTFADVGFDEGYRTGRDDGNALMFHLTIWVDDVDRFVVDPDHTATADGWVECAALGGRRPVRAGRVQPVHRRRERHADALPALVHRRQGAAGHPHRVQGDQGRPRLRRVAGHDHAVHPPARRPRRRARRRRRRGPGQRHHHHPSAGLPRAADDVPHARPRRQAEAAAFAAFGSVFMGKLWDVYPTGRAAGSSA